MHTSFFPIVEPGANTMSIGLDAMSGIYQDIDPYSPDEISPDKTTTAESKTKNHAGASASTTGFAPIATTPLGITNVANTALTPLSSETHRRTPRVYSSLYHAHCNLTTLFNEALSQRMFQIHILRLSPLHSDPSWTEQEDIDLIKAIKKNETSATEHISIGTKTPAECKRRYILLSMLLSSYCNSWLDSEHKLLITLLKIYPPHTYHRWKLISALHPTKNQIQCKNHLRNKAFQS
jgi:hypothetical protein